MLRSIFAAFVLLLFSSTVFATSPIRITKIVRASNFEMGDKNSTPIIYGGIAGSVEDCAIPLSPTEFCNNCHFGAEKACNERRIHPYLMLRIEFKVVDYVEGHVHFGYSIGAEIQEFQSYVRTEHALSKGDHGFIEIPWNELCRAAEYGNGRGSIVDYCEGGKGIVGDDLTTFISIERDNPIFHPRWSVQVNVSIQAPKGSEDKGIDTISLINPEGTGVIDFDSHPGRSKIHFSDISFSACSEGYKKARLFYSDVSLDRASYGTINYRDFAVDDKCKPMGKWTLSGLESKTGYWLRFSMIDRANNNVFLMNLEDMMTVHPTCKNIKRSGGPDTCPYFATTGARRP